MKECKISLTLPGVKISTWYHLHTDDTSCYSKKSIQWLYEEIATQWLYEEIKKKCREH